MRMLLVSMVMGMPVLAVCPLRRRGFIRGRRTRCAPVCVMLQPDVRMPFAMGNQLRVGRPGELRQLPQESHHIPDGFVIHAPLGPGRHPGSLDPVLDDPESAGIGSIRICIRRSVGEIGWYGIQAFPNFRVVVTRSEVTIGTHGVVIACAMANSLRIGKVLWHGYMGRRLGDRLFPGPSDQVQNRIRVGLVGCEADGPGLESPISSDEYGNDGEQTAGNEFVHGEGFKETFEGRVSTSALNEQLTL